MTNRFHWTALAACILAACGGDSSTGPGASPAVTLSLSSVSLPTFVVNSPTDVRIACVFDLRAVSGLDRDAAWADGEIRFAEGANRSLFVDTLHLTQTQVTNIWRAFTVGRTFATGTVQLSSPVAFTAQFVFRYREVQSGRAGEGTVSGACGPDAGAAVTPPVINVLSLSATPADLQVGDALQVTLDASATAGLTSWRLDVGGGCTMHLLGLDSLRTSAHHVLNFGVPTGCTVGSALQFVATIVDGAGQTVQRTLVGPPFADRRAPTLAPFIFSRGGRMIFTPGTPPDTSLLLPGDRLKTTPFARDDNRVVMLSWRFVPGGAADSLAINAPLLDTAISFPMASVNGLTALQMTARDGAGLTSAPLSLPVLVATPEVRAPLVRAQLPSNAQLIVDDRRGVAYNLYGLGWEAHSIATNAVLWQVPTSQNLRSPMLSISGDSLLWIDADINAVGVIDLRVAQPAVSYLRIPAANPALGRTAGAAALAANGKLFVLMRDTTSFVQEIDLGTLAQRGRPDAGPVTFGASNIAGSSTGHRLAIQANDLSIITYDAATDRFDASTPRPPLGGVVVVAPVGNALAAGLCLLDPATTQWHCAGPLTEGGKTNPPRRVQFAADGATLLALVPPDVTFGGFPVLWRISTATAGIVSGIPLDFDAASLWPIAGVSKTLLCSGSTGLCEVFDTH